MCSAPRPTGQLLPSCVNSICGFFFFISLLISFSSPLTAISSDKRSPLSATTLISGPPSRFRNITDLMGTPRLVGTPKSSCHPLILPPRQDWSGYRLKCVGEPIWWQLLTSCFDNGLEDLHVVRIGCSIVNNPLKLTTAVAGARCIPIRCHDRPWLNDLSGWIPTRITLIWIQPKPHCPPPSLMELIGMALWSTTASHIAHPRV